MKWGENAKVPESLRDRLIAKGAVPIMGTDGTYTRSATELAAMVIDAALPTLRTKEDLEGLPVGAQIIDNSTGIVWTLVDYGGGLREWANLTHVDRRVHDSAEMVEGTLTYLRLPDTSEG